MRFTLLAIALGALVPVQVVQAQEPNAQLPHGVIAQPSLSFDGAMKVFKAFEEASELEGWVTSIVILDRAGHELLVARKKDQDHTTVFFARAKAETALTIGKPTAAIHERFQGGDQNILSVDRMITIPGGVPILLDGGVIGAVGVSGSPAPIDHKIATAAVAAIMGPSTND
jgi:glc operon protein GlcG